MDTPNDFVVLIPSSVGEALGMLVRRAMRQEHITMREFAALVDISPTSLSAYLNEDREPHASTMFTLVAVLSSLLDVDEGITMMEIMRLTKASKARAGRFEEFVVAREVQQDGDGDGQGGHHDA